MFGNPEKNEVEIQDKYEDKCDKIDYIVAAACGTIAGLIDAFLVGAPGDSVLGTWTDAQVDKCVMSFAKMNGWPKSEGGGINNAIRYLERGSQSKSTSFKGFKVNYDQSVSSSASEVLGITPSNHHMKSLAHSPDIIGLYFSILNQFTSTSTFLSDGRLITMDTETFELYGSNKISKLFCGIANWFGHLMSDVAGSSTRTNRGSGIVMPFYELFGLCNFGDFSQGGERKTLADIATTAFEQGYDLRFGLATAIPVVLCNLSIRLIWAIRRFFGFKRPLKECIPTERHDSLRIMLLVGHGSLCMIDGVDALIRSGGNPLAFFMRINLAGWCVFAKLGVKQLFIKLGVKADFEGYVEDFKALNTVLSQYLEQLERIDIEAFRHEQERITIISMQLTSAASEEQLNSYLLQSAEQMGIKLCYDGTHEGFNRFFSDKSNKMVFQ